MEVVVIMRLTIDEVLKRTVVRNRHAVGAELTGVSNQGLASTERSGVEAVGLGQYGC